MAAANKKKNKENISEVDDVSLEELKNRIKSLDSEIKDSPRSKKLSKKIVKSVPVKSIKTVKSVPQPVVSDKKQNIRVKPKSANKINLEVEDQRSKRSVEEPKSEDNLGADDINHKDAKEWELSSKWSDNNNFIDIHSHILPGMDTGPKSMEDCMRMLKSALNAGVRKLVASPHRIKGVYEPSVVEIKTKVKEINDEAKRQGINIEILPGAENYAEYGPNMSLVVNNKNYYMIELPMRSYPEFCDDIIDDLFENNLIPIISNPEHNEDIRHNPGIIAKLVNKGCLIQVNAGSLFGKEGKIVREFALFLLQNNACHLVGSNAHNYKEYKYFSKIPALLKKYVSEEKAMEIFFEIPKYIIDGKKFVPEDITFSEKPHSRYRIRAFLKRFLPF